MIADYDFAILDRCDAPHVQPYRGVEFQRPATARRLGVAEHDADLLPQLIDEDDRGARAVDRAGKLAQRLAHEPRLQPRERVAHLAFDFGFRHERGDRIDDDDVDRARAHQDLTDLEALLAGIRLR